MNSCLIVYQDAEWRIVRHQCGRAQPYTLYQHHWSGWRIVRFFFEEQGARDYIARKTHASDLAPGAPAQARSPTCHQDISGLDNSGCARPWAGSDSHHGPGGQPEEYPCGSSLSTQPPAGRLPPRQRGSSPESTHRLGKAMQAFGLLPLLLLEETYPRLNPLEQWIASWPQAITLAIVAICALATVFVVLLLLSDSPRRR